MSDDGFDPAATAALANGDDVDADPGAGVDDPTPDDDVDVDEDEDEDVVAAGTIAATYLLPLLTAPERGPTAPMLQKRGMDGQTAALLDGLIDYVLEVVGIDLPADQLGPAGKIAVGVSSARARATGAGDDQGDDVQDDPVGAGAGEGGDFSAEAEAIMGDVPDA